MKGKNESQQWDDLLEQAFGSEKAADPGFAAPVPGAIKSAPKISFQETPPIYRRRRFWIAVAAAALLLGIVIWFLSGQTQA